MAGTCSSLPVEEDTVVEVCQEELPFFIDH